MIDLSSRITMITPEPSKPSTESIPSPSQSLTNLADEAEWGSRIEIKRLDKIRDPQRNSWILCETTDIEVVPTKHEPRYNKYADYAFIVRRKVIRMLDQSPTYETKVLVWSPWLRSLLEKNVLKGVQSVPWTAGDKPLKLDPSLLVAFLPRLKEYLEQIHHADIESEETRVTAQHLRLMIDYLESDYAPVLQKLQKLLSNREITWDLLWLILLPESPILTMCFVTSAKRAYKLRGIRKIMSSYGNSWELGCEWVETCYPGVDEVDVGWATTNLSIPEFEGRMKIDKLSVCPIAFWDSQVNETLLDRGRKWASIPQLAHIQYSGLGYGSQNRKHRVQGRVMIDRASFSFVRPSPVESRTVTLSQIDFDSCNDLFYASPILYGFDLTDKRWLEFNVENVSDIKWNDNIFRNLAIDENKKTILRSLIEVHAQDRPFDDFVEGKGLGLVINLFGPPGVGKSLTVEAMSEHLRRPLYVVGAGELGTDASNVENRLRGILSLIPKWNAILLIDEADIFLEKRGTQDLKRNAMVAVFLRAIEYFRGILFLTTNRAKEFDHAFQSRIHLSLHYKELTQEVRVQLWTAFVDKARDNPFGSEEISLPEINQLAGRNLNGRQIKNVVKVATSLARFEEAPIGYDHLVRSLNAGDDTSQVKAERSLD